MMVIETEESICFRTGTFLFRCEGRCLFCAELYLCYLGAMGVCVCV